MKPKNTKMEKYSLLYRLLSAPSPSGYEKEASDVFADFCKKTGLKHEFTDSIGNVAFSVGEGKIPFMVSGHID
jgi:putative aminopeptidase FrvX